METIVMLVILGWIGAMLGSFVGAQVWRLRARQLNEDKKQGETVDLAELKRIKRLIRPASTDRSECLYCHHQLAWYDLIPIFSWVTLGGKCRYCRHHIGIMELLLEIGLAGTFIASYFAWPVSVGSTYGLVSFVLWLVACTVMALLFAYDARWYLLPFSMNVTLIVVAIALAATRIYHEGAHIDMIWSMLFAIGILSGLYFIFSLFGWVGLGDSILGLGLAILLGNWQAAFLAVFLANLLGCFMLIPLYLQGRLRRNAHIPFGPFLIVGTLISMLWGSTIIHFVFASSDAFLNLLMV